MSAPIRPKPLLEIIVPVEEEVVVEPVGPPVPAPLAPLVPAPLAPPLLLVPAPLAPLLVPAPVLVSPVVAGGIAVQENWMEPPSGVGEHALFCGGLVAFVQFTEHAPSAQFSPAIFPCESQLSKLERAPLLVQ